MGGDVRVLTDEAARDVATGIIVDAVQAAVDARGSGRELVAAYLDLGLGELDAAFVGRLIDAAQAEVTVYWGRRP